MIGGLLDKPGGEKEVILGIDDELLKGTDRTIPRADVAEVAVQALLHLNSKNRAFDIATKVSTPQKTWKLFFDQSGNCKY